MSIPAKAKALMPRARIVLGTKHFVKAYQLAEKLGCSSIVAGQTLAALPEWSKYNPDSKRARQPWIKEGAFG